MSRSTRKIPLLRYTRRSGKYYKKYSNRHFRRIIKNRIIQDLFPLPNPNKVDREFDPKGLFYWSGQVPANVWRK